MVAQKVELLLLFTVGAHRRVRQRDWGVCHFWVTFSTLLSAGVSVSAASKSTVCVFVWVFLFCVFKHVFLSAVFLFCALVSSKMCLCFFLHHLLCCCETKPYCVFYFKGQIYPVSHSLTVHEGGFNHYTPSVWLCPIPLLYLHFFFSIAFPFSCYLF